MIAAIDTELFKNRFNAIAEEMGQALTRAAFSPNIRERRDHSCALFDRQGDMFAQAAHIPVHLGAAPLCVRAVIGALDLQPGQTAIVNDPYAGGTHLPDITLVRGVWADGEAKAVAWLAIRAHHADVGGIAPGSLPPSRHIDDEGWRIAPTVLDDAVVQSLCAASRTPRERRADLAAQGAALALGEQRLVALAKEVSWEKCRRMMGVVQDYTERLLATVLRGIAPRTVHHEDALDNCAADGPSIPLHVALTWNGERLVFDFRACPAQVQGPMNAPRAIAESAVFYLLMCLLPEGTPANSGVMRSVDVLTTPGSIVDPVYPAPVAAGNVETSQRLVDLLFGAMAPFLPMPACGQGTMNNVLIGSVDDASPWVMYETIGGGYGASKIRAGAGPVQVHMTNTLNTPIEALEHAYPIRIREYRRRTGSGGVGIHAGGDGLVRSFQALDDVVATVIMERRLAGPPGAVGGGAGMPGEQYIRAENGERRALASKTTVGLKAGDTLVVETPGGGGWGAVH
jgi:N-methylhydantoinase B